MCARKHDPSRHKWAPPLHLSVDAPEAGSTSTSGGDRGRSWSASDADGSMPCAHGGSMQPYRRVYDRAGAGASEHPPPRHSTCTTLLLDNSAASSPSRASVDGEALASVDDGYGNSTPDSVPGGAGPYHRRPDTSAGDSTGGSPCHATSHSPAAAAAAATKPAVWSRMLRRSARVQGLVCETPSPRSLSQVRPCVRDDTCGPLGVVAVA